MPTDQPVVFRSLKMTRTKHFIDGRQLSIKKLNKLVSADLRHLVSFNVKKMK